MKLPFVPSPQSVRKWKQLDNIPDELKRLRQWVCFEAKPREGHWGKSMISPITGKFAKSNAPETWTDFDTALSYAQTHKKDGLSFVLTSGIVFVDIDDVDEKPFEVKEKMIELASQLKTYCESSVSGKGLHFLCYGKLPENCRKKNDALGLEMYDTLRFVCMTGNSVGGVCEIRDLSDKIGDLNRKYLGKPVDYIPVIRKPATKSDRELIDLISNSRQGAKFKRLYRGDWQGSYGSHSSADFALVRILSYWTKDVAQIDSIFRSSGLFRPKWDKSDGYYGRRTISMAMSLAHSSAEM